MAAFLVAFEPMVLVLHFVGAVLLIVAILLQSGKGSDIGSAFGAGGSQSLFGARGASTFLTKTTTVIAIFFLATSLWLATTAKYMASGGGAGSLIKSELMKDGGTTPPVEVPLEEAK